MKLKERIYWNLYHPLMIFCVKLFYFLPVKKNKIVLVYNYGSGYGDSPKYIAEEIIRRKLSYDIVWLTSKDTNNQDLYPKQVRLALITRIKSVYELATAQVIVTTLKAKFNIKKKSSQFFVYVPHGQIGAKYVEAQAGDKLSKEYIEGSKWHSSVTDLALSSSKLFTEEIHKFYWYPDGEIAETGLPRNDVFFNFTQEDIVRIREQLNIASNVKIIFYAPTFRDNGNDKAYAIDTERIIKTLQEKTGDKWLMLVRMHPCFKWFKEPVFEYNEHVMNVTQYPDMQDLLLISDMLISDYSSTMFDFDLLHRPIFLFVNDVDDYQKMRGLKDWFFKVPFPFCKDNDELCEAIKSFDETKYAANCIEFDKLYGSLEKGTSAKSFVDRLETIMR